MQARRIIIQRESDQRFFWGLSGSGKPVWVNQIQLAYRFTHESDAIKSALKLISTPLPELIFITVPMRPVS